MLAMAELCDWDPKRDIPAWGDDGCKNPAVWSVGVKENWHLCETCAALPQFKKFRNRILLTR